MLSGNDVVTLQKTLLSAGFLKERYADGRFNLPTRQALMALEAENNLIPKGVVPQGEQSAILYYLTRADRQGDASGPVVVETGGVANSASPEKVIEEEWLTEANIDRVIVHWTAGNVVASNDDKSHYHFLIEEDGTVVQGKHSPTANSNPMPSPNSYAAHTLNCNTGSIGISICGMFEANEKPFLPGPYPFNELQWNVMAKAVAQLCDRYRLEVSDKTVLGHGEVQKNLGIKQRGKWDPMVLPWDPGLSYEEVGRKLRQDVKAALNAAGDYELVAMNAEVADKKIELGAVTYDVKPWLSLSALVEALKWQVIGPEDEDGGVILRIEDNDYFVPSFIRKEAGSVAQTVYVDARELAEALNLSVDVTTSSVRDTLRLTGKVGGTKERRGQTTYKFVVVRIGDTLRQIAGRELGDKDLWKDILDEDNKPFDEDSARRLVPGQIVKVPEKDKQANGGGTPAPALDKADFEKIGKDIAKAVREKVNAERAAKMVPDILTACAKLGVTDKAHIAYMFATAEHETNFGKNMTEIWGPSARQLRYQGKYGNDNPGDGERYRGRGAVQLTFKYNYERFGEALGKDLVKEPDLAARPDIAAEILVLGMTKLGYRGRNFVLSKYGFGDDFSFEKARAVVNNDVNEFEGRYNATRGVGVGRQARLYYDILLKFEI